MSINRYRIVETLCVVADALMYDYDSRTDRVGSSRQARADMWLEVWMRLDGSRLFVDEALKKLYGERRDQ